ncbi:NYN domain-containing protein [Thiorhodospira sibirica]|uniref:LabA-like NYN domain-containing protein n=1 Tax=Thiorhodospira sibirica TaxID=154347 RepID=UPI00022C5E15|nr:NYN domain-containing protein [Thiorhodospira sibirica]
MLAHSLNAQENPGASNTTPEYAMEKLVVFLDYANINAAFDLQGYIPDYQDLLAYLAEGRFLVEAHAFVPIDPRNPHARDHLIESLWDARYLVHSKVGSIAGETYRCDFDVEITLEMMRTAEIVRPDILVLVSGDKDFVPAVLELRRRGVRVEVAAFAGVNMARELQLKASGFIDLEVYLNENTDLANTPYPAEGAADEDDEDANSDAHPFDLRRYTQKYED